jgi:hypothetical protein
MRMDEILRFWAEVACENIQSLWESASDDRQRIIPCEVKQRRQSDVKNALNFQRLAGQFSHTLTAK